MVDLFSIFFRYFILNPIKNICANQLYTPINLIQTMSSYNNKLLPTFTAPRIVTFPGSPLKNQPLKLQKSTMLNPAENPSTKEFAFQLLEAELQLESGEHVNQGLITKLFQLYRLGIEYYNQRRSKKESFFKKKLEALTNNPVVLGALHDCDNGSDTFYKKKQIQKLVQIDQKKSLPANEIIKSVFQSQKRVQSELKSQFQVIQKRLNQRKLMKKSLHGDSTVDEKQVLEQSEIQRKKLTKTMIVTSTNPQDWDATKYLVDGGVISHQI